MSLGHAEWIGDRSLGHRLWEAGVTFVVGETGDIIARPETVLPALVPLLAVLAALALLAVRGDRGERRAGGLMLALAAVTVAVPLALALVVPGKDYVLARNLLPALVPLLVAVAIGVTLRRARRAGAVLGAVLVAYSLGFCVWVSLSPALQRPDWDAVAARLGEPDGAAGDRHLDAGRGLAALLPLDRLLPGPARRRLRLVRARSRLRLRRAGAARSRPPARARLPPGRLRAGRPPLREALRAARPRPGAACACARCATPTSTSARNGVLLDGIGRGDARRNWIWGYPERAPGESPARRWHDQDEGDTRPRTSIRLPVKTPTCSA